MNTLVIKLSGKALLDEDKLSLFFQNINLKNTKIILVHGGGIEVDNILNALNLPSDKINGVRVSTKEQIPYIVAVLAGLCNKKIQALLIKNKIKAQGILCTDHDITTLIKSSFEYGYVGYTKPNDKSFLDYLLQKDIVPIIASIGILDNGDILNINADDVAKSIASLYKCPLIFLSDVIGVFDANKDVIPCIDKSYYQELLDNNVIKDGMALKVKEALDTAEYTKSSIFITSLDNPYLQDLSTLRRLGTEIKA